MDEDAQKLEALKDQFVYHFPHVRELATADPGIFALDESTGRSQEGTRRAKRPESRPLLRRKSTMKSIRGKWRVNRSTWGLHRRESNPGDYQQARLRQPTVPKRAAGQQTDVWGWANDVEGPTGDEEEYKTSQRVAQRRDERVGENHRSTTYLTSMSGSLPSCRRRSRLPAS